ncbi:coiled-coil domain-containing protein 186-like [Chenopodium quinoa]|uniref:coiled-coil domain-containing protein 186-like n=1 Tax=Chenopodium quinoa TaxID=63459 RepID=UPI000B76D7F7|nr:coiled-coil domain-containing protein 186-like [Chenopodium quinoa]
MSKDERLAEGYSTQRPPLFNGKYYAYWKTRMEMFIQSENYQVWRAIEVGDYEVTKTNAENEVIPKPISEYDRSDFEKKEINATAKKLLVWGLGPDEHTRVMGCKTTKEIWDLLEITHEGTHEFKRSKIDILLSKYERFEMGSKETIQEMFTRFKNITNELVSLGSLITHELHLSNKSQESSKSRGIALKVAQPSEEDFESGEEEAAMLVKKLKRLYRNKRFGDQKKRNFKKNQYSKETGGCHKCGNTDHFIKEFPLWESEKGKGKMKEHGKSYTPNFSKSDYRKAMIAAWGDTSSEDEEESTEEETANLCLMAKHSESAKKSEEVNLEPKFLKSLSKDKLISLLIETLDEYKEICLKLGQNEKALEIYKDHMKYLNSSRTDVQGRFFDLLDRNTMLKETLERVKNENIMLNVELTQYKLLCTNIDSNSALQLPLVTFNDDLENLKKELQVTKHKNESLEKDLERARNNKSAIHMGVPKWISEAQTRRTEGLGFNHKKKNSGKKKKYVELPSETVCSFCGKSGHKDTECKRKELKSTKNIAYAWQKKNESAVSTKEPMKDGVPESNP